MSDKEYYKQYYQEHKEECNQRTMEWQKNSDKYKETHAKNNLAYYYRNKDKCLARSYVYKAVHRGKMFKPMICEKCGCYGDMHAHHWSYEKEHWLDVIWLCPNCHRKEHECYSR